MPSRLRKKIQDYLREPSVRSLDPDSLEYSLAHRHIIERKVILRKFFEDLYRRCDCDRVG